MCVRTRRGGRQQRARRSAAALPWRLHRGGSARPLSSPDPIKVADLTTPVPGGGAFLEFGSVAVSGSGAVVFDAWYSGGGVLYHGLFTNIAGTLMKVLDNTESVGGKPLADFSFGSGGFGGARAVFTALFPDGSQAIAAARVNNLKCSQVDGDEPCDD